MVKLLQKYIIIKRVSWNNFSMQPLNVLHHSDRNWRLVSVGYEHLNKLRLDFRANRVNQLAIFQLWC